MAWLLRMAGLRDLRRDDGVSDLPADVLGDGMIKRYKKIMSSETGYRDQMLVRPDGNWAKYDEAQSEIDRLKAELSAERALADRLRGEVCGLWMLLDDIDTLDDACKDNDAVFRKRCYDKQRSRFNIVSGEAYDDYRKARWL